MVKKTDTKTLPIFMRSHHVASNKLLTLHFDFAFVFVFVFAFVFCRVCPSGTSTVGIANPMGGDVWTAEGGAPLLCSNPETHCPKGEKKCEAKSVHSCIHIGLYILPSSVFI